MIDSNEAKNANSPFFVSFTGTLWSRDYSQPMIARNEGICLLEFSFHRKSMNLDAFTTFGWINR